MFKYGSWETSTYGSLEGFSIPTLCISPHPMSVAKTNKGGCPFKRRAQSDVFLAMSHSDLGAS
jgi:hypothetical protein